MTVTVGGAGSGVTVDTDGEASGDQNTLTFTASDYAEAQTVTVSAADDANAVDEVVTLTHTVSGADYGANAVTAGSVVVTVADDETPRLAIDGPSVNEGDVGSTTMTFTVTLIPASSGQVTVGLRGRGHRHGDLGDRLHGAHGGHADLRGGGDQQDVHGCRSPATPRTSRTRPSR